MPVYFLIDVSESMIGGPLEWMQKGLDGMNSKFKKERLVTDRVLVSLIVFAGKVKRILPLTGTQQFYSPVFTVGRGTSTGNALTFLMDELTGQLNADIPAEKECDSPLVFLLTDGPPTDAVDSVFRRWNFSYRDRVELIAVSIGWNKIISLLKGITPSVFVLERTDDEGFSWLFRWIAAVVRRRCKEKGNFPRLSGSCVIAATKKRMNKEIKRENFLVFLGKCQITKSLYLIKYVRQNSTPARCDIADTEKFELVGAYPVSRFYYELSDKGINRKIRTENLTEFPVCPCCGNQYSYVTCECGRAFCADERAYNKCPWCGYRGILVSMD